MMRFAFLLLVLANLALGAYLYTKADRPSSELPREVERESIKIVTVSDPAKARKDASETRKLIESLAGAKCLKLAVRSGDSARAQMALAGLLPVDRIATRVVEEFTRFAVALPAQRDRRSADTLFASLRKANVKDMSILADHSISLGVFSTDEAARRVVADLEMRAGALVKGITVTPRNPQAKETQFTLRDVDAALLGKFAVLQRDFDGSALTAADCADPVPAAAASETPPKAP